MAAFQNFVKYYFSKFIRTSICLINDICLLYGFKTIYKIYTLLLSLLKNYFNLLDILLTVLSDINILDRRESLLLKVVYNFVSESAM